MTKAKSSAAEQKKAPTKALKATAEVESDNSKKGHKYGQWDLKYLQFVSAFITQTGMTYAEAAAKAGITRQTIHHWFELDDAKISSIIKFIDKCGYTVKFALKPDNDKIGDALVTINCRDTFDTIGDKKLSFLDEAIDRYGIVRKDAAEKLGISYTALYYWFQHDDVFISYVYKIAEQNNLKMVIRIDPQKEYSFNRINR